MTAAAEHPLPCGRRTSAGGPRGAAWALVAGYLGLGPLSRQDIPTGIHI